VTFFALRILSFVLSVAPGFVHRVLTVTFGDFTFFCLPRRRRIILSNLDHAFPERPREWLHRLGRQSCRQMVETSLLSLILPHLSVSRVRRMIRLNDATIEHLRTLLAGQKPVVFVTPHLGGWELGACLSALVGPIQREMGCIYRPLDNPELDAWVVRARSRFGITMMSRRKGLADAMRLLRGGGVFFILFDQTGPASGQLSVLLNRLCLSTPLPGLMVEKFNASLNTYVLRRVSFWRYQIDSHTIDGPRNADEITRHLDNWLGNLLRNNEQICGTWLWAHNRWKLRQQPENQFRLEHRRSALLKQETIPRTTRFFVRLPDQLQTILWTLPLLRVLRTSRPDASITALTNLEFAELLADSDFFEEIMTTPPAQEARTFTRSLYHKFPDYWISLDDSGTTDVEAKASRCPERFGIQGAGKRRNQLNRLWKLPPSLDETLEHRLRILERFFRHFGLQGEINLDPVRLCKPPNSTDAQRDRPVLFAARNEESSNEDYWPVAQWQDLVARFTREAGQPALILKNLRSASCGITTVSEDISWAGLAKHVQLCRLMVTDDLELLHLAGALGVAAIGLFGRANPRREGPVFAAPAWVLQPPDCPETGGKPLRELEPGAVFDQIRAALSASVER